MTLLADFPKVYRKVKYQYLTHRHITLDVARQKRELRDYSSGVTEIIDCAPLDSATYAAFVFYEPGNEISNSVERVLRSLREHGVNVVVLCNHELGPGQIAFFRSHAHSVILRNNQGYDFGAYKDAIRHFRQMSTNVDRLLVMNDSVFYSSVGLDDFIENMLGPEDVIGAYENWADDHHLQSFALSFSSHVLNDSRFLEFWDDYVPVNNRVHAIEKGEKPLTWAAFSAARSTRVIFSVGLLDTMLKAQKQEPFSTLTVFAEPWRQSVAAADLDDVPWPMRVTTYVQTINVTSPVHSGAYFFPKLLKSPLFKKDLVYRNRFQFWEIESWIGELIPENEAEEYLEILRKKGDAGSLSRIDLDRYRVGAK